MSSLRKVVVVLALTVGCSAQDEPAGADALVGHVMGIDAFIGAVVDDASLMAYVCDGSPERSTTISSWFVAEILDGAFDVENPGGSSLAGELQGSTLSGTYASPAGVESTFVAELAESPSGLYFGERGHGEEEIWGGWIVIDADQRGAVVDRTTGDIVGAPAIDPMASSVEVEGEPLEYEVVDEPIGEALDDVPPG